MTSTLSRHDRILYQARDQQLMGDDAFNREVEADASRQSRPDQGVSQCACP